MRLLQPETVSLEVSMARLGSATSQGDPFMAVPVAVLLRRIRDDSALRLLGLFACLRAHAFFRHGAVHDTRLSKPGLRRAKARQLYLVRVAHPLLAILILSSAAPSP